MTFDPDNWLVSGTRELQDYVTAYIATNLPDDYEDVSVEMSWPDTEHWTKETPLAKSIIHFEQDDANSTVLGFGTPGVDVFDEVEGTFELHEAAQHLVNYDVGVWVSAEGGGATKRMQLVQALKNCFVPAGARIELNETTGGVNVISFNGGQNHIDRINDLPVWRAMNMTLIVRLFSRHVPSTPEVIPTIFTQTEDLSINVGGADVPLT